MPSQRKSMDRQVNSKKCRLLTRGTRIIQSMSIGPYIALDCEMVGVGPDGIDSAVARVSIVDGRKNEVLLDTFVKVSVPVTDYRTFISGVTSSDIESDDAMNLDECRSLVEYILKGRILIGHGIDNDLTALGIFHPFHDTRDTSTYVPFMQVSIVGTHGREMRPRKLKDLASEKLGTCIQQLGEAHSSVEDAKAALSLYKLVRNEWETLINWQKKTAANPEFYNRFGDKPASYPETSYSFGKKATALQYPHGKAMSMPPAATNKGRVWFSAQPNHLIRVVPY